MVRYHIAPDGRVLRCKAEIQCDYTDESGREPIHFSDRESAYQYIEQVETARHGVLPSVSTPAPAPQSNSDLAKAAQSDSLASAREKLLVLHGKGGLVYGYPEEAKAAREEHEARRHVEDHARTLKRIEEIGKDPRVPEEKKEDMRRRWRETKRKLHEAESVWVSKKDTLDGLQKSAKVQLLLLEKQRSELDSRRMDSDAGVGELSLTSPVSMKSMANYKNHAKFSGMSHAYKNGNVDVRHRIAKIMFGKQEHFMRDYSEFSRISKEIERLESTKTPQNAQAFDKRVASLKKSRARFSYTDEVVRNALNFAEKTASESENDVLYAESAARKTMSRNSSR